MSARSRAHPWFGERCRPVQFEPVRYEPIEPVPPDPSGAIHVSFKESVPVFRETMRYAGELLGRPVFIVDRMDWDKNGKRPRRRRGLIRA